MTRAEILAPLALNPHALAIFAVQLAHLGGRIDDDSFDPALVVRALRDVEKSTIVRPGAKRGRRMLAARELAAVRAVRERLERGGP